MKTYTFLILSLLFILFADSCRKKGCPKNIPFITIEQEMYDWIVFQPGSYWIYTDSITGAYDSVYVTEVYKDTESLVLDKKCAIQQNETVHVMMTSYYENKNIELRGRYGIGSGVQNNTNPVRGGVDIDNLNHSGGDGGFSHYMYFPVLQGTKGAWNGYTIIEHDTIYKQYGLNGQNYENVLRVSDGLNGALNAITKFYHCKHIGVIKKEIYRFKDFNDKEEPELLHVWELVKYEVNQ